VRFSAGAALADSVIDAAIKPYFVLGGLVTAVVFSSVGLLIHGLRSLMAGARGLGGLD
jgi:hypothetical protein